MEFLKNLFEKLTAPSSESVGVYVSSDSKLEIIVYDKDMAQVKKCEKTDLKYDNVLRQVSPEEFEAALVYLVSQMDIPSNYPFYVSLPNILTSTSSFPSDLEDIELEVAMNSEAEKSYIFKKAEPKSSWSLLSTDDQTLTNRYLYSVIQREQALIIEDIFARNNLRLFAIDTSFASLIRGLAVSGILKENIESNSKWAIVTISYNNYIIAKFEGSELVNIIETPLALKSIEPEILYPTISVAVSEKLGVDGLDNLYLVSQTSDFIAENLASHIKLICNVYTIDNNKFNNKPLFLSQSSDALEPTSPESVGAACWGSEEITLSFNFCSTDKKDEMQGVFGKIGIKKPVHLYLFLGIIIAFLLVTIISLTLAGVNYIVTEQIKKESVELNKLKKVNVPPPKVFNLNNIIYQAYNENIDLLDSYDAIGATIPEKIWLESFFIDGDLNTIIKGKAYNVEDIIIYFENIKKKTKFKNLNVKYIKVETGKIISTNYTEEGGLSIPMPPVGANSHTSNISNYYEFVFQDTKPTQKNESLFDSLPDPLRSIFGN